MPCSIWLCAHVLGLMACEELFTFNALCVKCFSSAQVKVSLLHAISLADLWLGFALAVFEVWLLLCTYVCLVVQSGLGTK